MATQMEQATQRVKNALAVLNEKADKGYMLHSVAEMVVTADGLLSALVFIQETLYEECKSRGLIGLRPKWRKVKASLREKR